MSFPKKPTKKRLVYLDHAATTPTDPRVVKAMAPFWTHDFANPSALYSLGQMSHEAVETARASMAEILFTQPDCITFTSGGTEANNLAILGLIEKVRLTNKKIHIITTAIEHHSVLEPIKELAKHGVMVTYLAVNERGEISVKELIAAIRPETVLISIMYANNEIGTINPIAEIGRELLKYRKNNKTQFPFFHTDGCQAAGTLDLHVERLHVDLMTINGSKIYGPKGVGALFVRRGVTLKPIMFGGGQENALRSGTENVPAIIGFAKALQLVQKKYSQEAARQMKLRDFFWKEINKKIPGVKLNGPELNGENRLANNLNIQFTGLEGETLVLYLDAYGIICATGSACATDSDDASHVLTACGLKLAEAKASVRFTLGKETNRTEIDYVMKYLPGIVKGIREMQKSV